MRVCMMTRTMPAHTLGGMELHIKTLAETLAELGIEVIIVTTSHPEGLEIERSGGITIHYLKNTAPGVYSRSWWKQSSSFVQKLHAQQPFDIIHSQSAAAFSLMKELNQTDIDLPVVLSLHGTVIDEIKTKLRLGFYPRAMAGLVKNLLIYIFRDRKMIPQANAVIATSPRQYDTIKKWFKVDEKDISMVLNGIDENLFCPSAAEQYAESSVVSYHDDTPKILAVARLKKEKGIQGIISAMPEVLNKIPNCRLIIGGSGEYESKLKALSEKLGISDNVDFLGSVPFDELPDLMNSCSLFVNSTLRENGYDLSVIQAMSCGKPVVVSAIPSLSDVIHNGIEGRVYPIGNTSSLAEAVCDILSSSETASIMGKAGREAVVKQYGLKTMGENTIKVYKKALDND